MIKLFKHQHDYLTNRNHDRDLLAHEGGTGKTVIAVEWLRSRNHSRALVLCPMRVKEKWRAELGDVTATIMHDRQFVRDGFDSPTAIIVDEADEWASPLFVAKDRSQRTEALYHLIRQNPNAPVLLLTATPIRSTPWNLHTLLCFMGVYIPKDKWRDRFFTLERRPFLPRPAYFATPTWRTDIRSTLEKYAHIVLMRDCVSDLPPVTERVVTVRSAPFTPMNEWEPARAFVEEHQHEQKAKLPTIKEIGREYRKVVVVAHYREQCETLAKELGKERQTFLMMGGIKNQEAVIRQAQESDECYFVIQASLSAGYDLDTFSCVVFASMSYRFVDYEQQKFRVRRIKNLHPVIYHYLIGGRRDKAVYDTVMLGKDFSPAYYMAHHASSAS